MELSRSLLDAIHRQLVAEYPAEGCGLLLGIRSNGGAPAVHRALPARNDRTRDGAARNRYLIGPEDFLAAERNASAAGLEIVGAYHSHPDAPPWPSAYDREHAWPWLTYLIVSVMRGTAQDARVWQITDDRTDFVERQLVVKEP